MSNYVVVDLEMCNVPKEFRTKEFHYATEIIQIGAVLLDENYETIDEFSVFVSPEFGSLDCSIRKLTGITEDDLQDAPMVREAFEMFCDWLPQKDTIFVQWSNNDELQIKRELKGKAINNPKMEQLLENCEDCQKLFKERVDAGRVYSLSDAVNAAGLDAVGYEHNALYDAQNTALLFRKLLTEPELKLHPIYEIARSENVEHLGYSFGSLLSGFDFSALPA